ncbi:MAG: hypothetical protein PF486_08340 [Prolixibacteraceae bacterium]|nr:hypothetical protein [Prolixibacteraceae bacterium]
MSIAVIRSDYVTFCAASTSVLFDPDVHRDIPQLIIFAERYCDTKSYYIIALLGVTTT